MVSGAAGLATITSVTIGGELRGTSASGDHSGFVAVAIGSIKMDSTTHALLSTSGYLQLAPLTRDLAVHLI